MKTVKSIVFLLLTSLSGCGYIHHQLYMTKIHEEERQVIDFVKGNKDVIREVGSIKDAIPSSSRIEQGEAYPSRYVVKVYGETFTTAVVKVSRSLGGVQFTLACLGHFPPLKDATKDRYECKE